MKIKTILFMVLSLMSFTVFAQNNGGVKGKVVSRTTRAAIDGVKVTLTPGDVTTKTDAVTSLSKTWQKENTLCLSKLQSSNL